MSGEVEEQDQEDTMMTINQIVSDVQDNDAGSCLDDADRLKGSSSKSTIFDEDKVTSNERVITPKPHQSKLEMEFPQISGELKTSCLTSNMKPLYVPQLPTQGSGMSLPSTSSLNTVTRTSVADDSDSRNGEIFNQVDKQWDLPLGTLKETIPPPVISFPVLQDYDGFPPIDLPEID